MNALAVCVIVVSAGTNGNYAEKREHEIAHCNGWVHQDRVVQAGYRAYAPPKRFVHPYRGRLVEHRVSLGEAKRLCGGHFACQWFE